MRGFGAYADTRSEQMQITLNDQGYIESYALIGGLVDGVEIEAPDDLLEDFKQHPEAYKLEDGVLVLDADKLKADADAAELTIIRCRCGCGGANHYSVPPRNRVLCVHQSRRAVV